MNKKKYNIWLTDKEYEVISSYVFGGSKRVVYSVLSDFIVEAAIDKVIMSSSINAYKSGLLEAVMESVCIGYGVMPKMIISPSRQRAVVRARHAYNYLANRFTSFTLKEIGNSVGGRDHSTVIHSRDYIKTLIEQKHLAIHKMEHGMFVKSTELLLSKLAKNEETNSNDSDIGNADNADNADFNSESQVQKVKLEGIKTQDIPNSRLALQEVRCALQAHIPNRDERKRVEIPRLP